MSRFPALLLAASLSLASAGCSGPQSAPSAPATSPASSSAGPSWPAVAGRVVQASSGGGMTRRRIAVTDPEVAYADARMLLVGAGFQLTKDRAGRGGGDGQACTSELCVQFTATTAQPWGPNLLYEAFRPNGVAPLQ